MEDVHGEPRKTPTVVHLRPYRRPSRILWVKQVSVDEIDELLNQRRRRITRRAGEVVRKDVRRRGSSRGASGGFDRRHNQERATDGGGEKLVVGLWRGLHGCRPWPAVRATLTPRRHDHGVR